MVVGSAPHWAHFCFWRLLGLAEGGAALHRHRAHLRPVPAPLQGNVAVEQAFDELVLKILDTPPLLAGTAAAFGLKAKQQPQQAQGMCCG